MGECMVRSHLLSILTGTAHVLKFLIAQRRDLSTRATKILSALDIPTDSTKLVSGVYDGAWGGSGEPLESRCPSTGELLAKVSTVSSVHWS